MSSLIIKDEPLNVAPSLSKNKRIKILKKYPKSRLPTDSKTALKLVEFFDKENEIDGNPLQEMEFSDKGKCFDLCLLYLRKVHAYDYFSGS